jgi:energy-coupling factor transporter ATP-binding protein EcfA2
MLKRLHLRNFTVFADAEFEFGAGLNVLVGANGTGKTHVLKAGYVGEAVREEIKNNGGSNIEKAFMEAYGNKMPIPWGVRTRRYLPKLFATNRINDVVRYSVPKRHAIIETAFATGVDEEKSIEILIDSEEEALRVISDDNKFPEDEELLPPVFIPAKEVLTLGWLPSLYNRFDIPFDVTYPDLLRLLSGPSLRQPEPTHIVENLAQLIGGKVEEEGGHFYLNMPDRPRMEMNFVAEGMRKFATLYKLLANGTLTPETTLFWDEPEANLNPALLKDMAVVLTDLAEAGFQIILATHSLFLMRELHILAQQRKKPVRYFGLYASEEGDVRVERQDDLMQLRHLVALDAELAQTFDFEAALDQDYAGDN